MFIPENYLVNIALFLLGGIVFLRLFARLLIIGKIFSIFTPFRRSSRESEEKGSTSFLPFLLVAFLILFIWRSIDEKGNSPDPFEPERVENNDQKETPQEPVQGIKEEDSKIFRDFSGKERPVRVSFTETPDERNAEYEYEPVEKNWHVQVGAFKVKEYADNYVDKLIEMGLAEVLIIESAYFYHVMTGRFASKEEATYHRERLKRMYDFARKETIMVVDDRTIHININ